MDRRTLYQPNSSTPKFEIFYRLDLPLPFGAGMRKCSSREKFKGKKKLIFIPHIYSTSKSFAFIRSFVLRSYSLCASNEYIFLDYANFGFSGRFSLLNRVRTDWTVNIFVGTFQRTNDKIITSSFQRSQTMTMSVFTIRACDTSWDESEKPRLLFSKY